MATGKTISQLLRVTDITGKEIVPLDVYDEESGNYITRGITLDDMFKVIYNKIQEVNDKVVTHDTSINNLNNVTDTLNKNIEDVDQSISNIEDAQTAFDNDLTTIKSDLTNKLNKVKGSSSTDSFVTITADDVTNNEQTITPSVKTVDINNATTENNGLATALDVLLQLANYAKSATITDDTLTLN